MTSSTGGWSTAQALERLRGIAPVQVTGRRWKKQHRLNFATENCGGSNKQEGLVHQHWEEEQAGVFQPWERGRKLQLQLPLLLPCMLQRGFPAGDRGKAGVLGMHCTSLC